MWRAALMRASNAWLSILERGIQSRKIIG
jgi:hypothetical protein